MSNIIFISQVEKKGIKRLNVYQVYTETDPELEFEFSEFHISTQISRPSYFPELLVSNKFNEITWYHDLYSYFTV